MSYTPQENLSITSAIGINSDTGTTGGNWSVNTYTGVGELNDYAYVGVNLQADESGTLYFDFSQDGTNWSTYPVNGFTVASGKVIATFGVTEVGNIFSNLTDRNIAVRPSKTLAFITQGDNPTETIVDISWVEDF